VAARPRLTRPDLILAGLGLLTFALIPIRINTIYSGLPAHPLFLHVPVILIPVVAIAGLVLAVWPRFFVRHGGWIGALTVIALGATNLTMGAGQQLRNDLHLAAGPAGGFGPSELVSRHAHAADMLRLLLIAFTAVFIVGLALYRTDSLAELRGSAGVLVRVALAGLAIACAYFVFHTGDLGAKAVWQGRTGRAGFGGPSFPTPGGGSGGVGIPGPSGGGSGSGGAGLPSPGSG
jgi:hypothetical protein